MRARALSALALRVHPLHWTVLRHTCAVPNAPCLAPALAQGSVVCGCASAMCANLATNAVMSNPRCAQRGVLGTCACAQLPVALALNAHVLAPNAVNRARCAQCAVLAHTSDVAGLSCGVRTQAPSWRHERGAPGYWLTTSAQIFDGRWEQHLLCACRSQLAAPCTHYHPPPSYSAAAPFLCLCCAG